MWVKYICRQLKTSAVTSIDKNKIKRALLVYAKINTYKNIVNIPQRYLAVGKSAGIADDDYGLEIFWKDSIEKKKKKKPRRWTIRNS